MSSEKLFDVVFEGRPLPGIPLENAIDGLAGLSKKQPDDIDHLFNERLTALKRGVSQKTALQYCQVLQKAGLACHINPAGSPLNTGKVKKSSNVDVNSASPSPAAAYKTVKGNITNTSKQTESEAVESDSSSDRW